MPDNVAARVSGGDARPELLDAVDPVLGLRHVLLRRATGEGGFELFEQLLLLARQAHRRLHHHAADQVPVPAAAHRLYAAPAQAQLMAGLRLRRDGDFHLALQRGHRQLRAQRRLREADRHLAVQVVAVALEDRVLAHAHFHVEITRLGAGRTGLTLPGQANSVAVVDARGNAHRQFAHLFQASLAVAVLAGLLDGLAAAAAVRAGLLDREDAVLHAHAAVAVAGAALHSLAVGRAGAVAVVAIHLGRNLDGAFDTE